MVGSAIAGLYLTLTAATVLYDIVPLSFALPLALGIGAVATAIAVRWNTRTVAALGVGGTLLAPALSEVLTTGAMVFLAIASASAVGVLVWRRWPWLAVAASGITLAQVAVWATAGGTQVMELVIVLSVFAALNLGLALGYELRDATTSLEPSSALLVPFGALVLGALGYYGLPHGVGELAGGLWLVALAVAHAALGGLAFRLPRASHRSGWCCSLRLWCSATWPSACSATAGFSVGLGGLRRRLRCRGSPLHGPGRADLHDSRLSAGARDRERPALPGTNPAVGGGGRRRPSGRSRH